MTDITGIVNLVLLVAVIAYLGSMRSIFTRIAVALEKLAWPRAADRPVASSEEE